MLAAIVSGEGFNGPIAGSLDFIAGEASIESCDACVEIEAPRSIETAKARVERKVSEIFTIWVTEG
jgi:hypothetical protein